MVRWWWCVQPMYAGLCFTHDLKTAQNVLLYMYWLHT